MWACRDGVVSKRKNFESVREHEAEKLEAQEMAANVKRIRSNPAIYREWPLNPEAVAWLDRFKVDALRYPILIVLGPSLTGKTEWVKSLFQRPHECPPRFRKTKAFIWVPIARYAAFAFKRI